MSRGNEPRVCIAQYVRVSGIICYFWYVNKTLVCILLLIQTKTGWAQENLVPNPSFEENIGCPFSGGQIDAIAPWVKVDNSPDYFHECGTNGYGIPVNKVGWGYANLGQAYVGLGIRTISDPPYREFIGVLLNSALIPAKRYNVEFYVSFADSIWYATKSIGAYFSVGEPPSNTDMLSYEPQVKYTGDEFLTDKEGWTKIEGSFIADGGEKFITIGNFDTNEETDTMFVSGGGVFRPNQPDYWRSAYYFIDDVSVTVDTTTGINELEQVKFEVYPNPANEKLIIETEQVNEQNSFQLMDITGRVVFTLAVQAAKTSVDISMLGTGVYVVVLEQKGGMVVRRKIVVE